MSTYGPIKTLFLALRGSALMSGISVVFGMEEIAERHYTLPLVVMVPLGGPYNYAEQGYSFTGDPLTVQSWATNELVEFWCTAASTVGAEQGSVDHADACETLRLAVLNALEDQRSTYADVAFPTYGINYQPINGRWESFESAVSPYGRSYVLSVRIFVSVQNATGPTGQATITSTSQSDNI